MRDTRERLEAEDLADVGGDAEIGLAVARGGGAVDDDGRRPVKKSMRPAAGTRQATPRSATTSRSACAMAFTAPCTVRSGTLVQHDVGFDDAAAGGHHDTLSSDCAKGQQVVYRVGCAARHAEVAQHAADAVRARHVLAAALMGVILRHHGVAAARLLEFGQLAMRAVRLRVERRHAVAVEVEERWGWRRRSCG